VTARAPGDLSQLVVGEVALLEAVELRERREGHALEVEVEAHADGVGGDEVLHLSGLVHRDLRVACAWREPTEHHRDTAAQFPQRLRQLVDALGGEGDDGRPRRQPLERLGAEVLQLREALAAAERDVGQQLREQWSHRLGAEEPRLLAPPRMQEPVGEHVPALAVRAQLHLVDREEVDLPIERHRLDGAHPIRRVRRDALLFAGHQRDACLADARGHPVVDLAREQPQREAHHAALVLEHALDGPPRLAGVGRPELSDEV